MPLLGCCAVVKQKIILLINSCIKKASAVDNGLTEDLCGLNYCDVVRLYGLATAEDPISHPQNDP